MNSRIFQGALAVLVLAMLVMAATPANALVQTMTSTATVVSNDNWNQTPNWDNATVPSGIDSAVISAGLAARLSAYSRPPAA